MPSGTLIRAFLQQASAAGSKSTVLLPIAWMIAICISATLASAFLSLAAWITYMFAIFCALTMLLYLGSYVFCLMKDRDALRSESYTIQKMAIEKGFVGDSLLGTLTANETPDGRLLPSPGEIAGEADK